MTASILGRATWGIVSSPIGKTLQESEVVFTLWLAEIGREPWILEWNLSTEERGVLISGGGFVHFWDITKRERVPTSLRGFQIQNR